MPLIARTALLVLLLAGCSRAPETSASIVNLEFVLTDESGTLVTQDNFQSRVQLVFFGFTSCPDICPLTLQNIAVALRTIGKDANDVEVLFISIDPHRDTPQQLKLYTDAFHQSVIGLSGSWAQLEAVTTVLRTTFGHTVIDDQGASRPLSRDEYEALPNAATYLPFHSSQLYVVSHDHRLLDIIGYGSEPAQIVATLRKFLQ